MILSFSVVMVFHSLTSNCLAATISSSLFLPSIIWSFTHTFSNVWPIYLCQTSISLTLSLSVSSYSKSSSAFNSLCLSRFSYWWSMHLCCLFLFFSFPHRACNYVPVRGIMFWMARYTVNEPTLAKLLINCPKWALESMKCIRFQCNGQVTMMTTFGYVRDTSWNMNFKLVTNKQTTH